MFTSRATCGRPAKKSLSATPNDKSLVRKFYSEFTTATGSCRVFVDQQAFLLKSQINGGRSQTKAPTNPEMPDVPNDLYRKGRGHHPRLHKGRGQNMLITPTAVIHDRHQPVKSTP
jgi:hypothetical protein